LSGREAGRGAPAAAASSVDPDSLEVAPGTAHERLEGSIPSLASEEELRIALEQAFDYRGDVSITKKDGSKVEGYIFDRGFDRKIGTSLAASFVRLWPKDGSPKLKISYADIAALAFSGRDMAAGRNWETWVKSYWQRKAAGEKDISLQPEELE
jgi:hypothetical protein